MQAPEVLGGRYEVRGVLGRGGMAEVVDSASRPAVPEPCQHEHLGDSAAAEDVAAPTTATDYAGPGG